MSIQQFRRRVRDLAVPEVVGTWYDWVGDSSPSGTQTAVLRTEKSEVLDENHGHRWWKDKSFDMGGNFDLHRTITEHNPATVGAIYRPVGQGRSGLAYSGKILAATPPVPSISDAKSWGAYNAPALYNKARPAQPVFEGLNAFYELKDVLPMLKTRTSDLLKQGAGFDTYLAYKFGWAPLLTDLRDFAISHFAIRKALDQLRRDEGKAVRRTARLRTDSFENVYPQSPSYSALGPTFVTQMYADEPTSALSYASETKVWFVGEFKYWLPPKFHSDSWYWTPSVLATMYGFNPTPARVYKAIPWSWLFDWFSNTGNVIGTMSSTIGERLATSYAYVMCSIKGVNTRHSWGHFFPQNDRDTTLPVSATCTCTREHLSRVDAGIFGPTVSLNQLSETQTDILGAIIGKSR